MKRQFSDAGQKAGQASGARERIHRTSVAQGRFQAVARLEREARISTNPEVLADRGDIKRYPLVWVCLQQDPGAEEAAQFCNPAGFFSFCGCKNYVRENPQTGVVGKIS